MADSGRDTATAGIVTTPIDQFSRRALLFRNNSIMLYYNIMAMLIVMGNPRYDSLPSFGRFAEPGHNHAYCLKGIQARADEICGRRGVRLTKIRRDVLGLVWRSHRPVGAYDILALLSEEGRTIAPPTVYRALDFLLEQELVHRIETLNAFVGCSNPGHAHRGYFLICQMCRGVAEIGGESISRAIEKNAAAAEFLVETSNVEVLGLCFPCRDRK